MTATARESRVGAMLREWRQRRRLSQLDLALEAGVSARHLSFVETGRSKPSSAMVLQLAEQLEVPLRDRNQLLLAAGYAPVYGERELDAPEMSPVRDALRRLLAGHEPFPAIAVDRAWNLVAGNGALDVLIAGVDPRLLQPPANTMRLALHPAGMAPRIANLPEWRAHLLERLERQVGVTGDPQQRALLEEVRAYGGGDDAAAHVPPAATDLFVPLRIRHDGAELSFFSTVSTFGTATDITLAELAIESFFPADEATAAALRTLA